MNYNDAKGFFRNEGEYIIFVILHTDGKTRQNLLGVTDNHYHCVLTAKVWHNSISTALNTLDNVPAKVYTYIGRLYNDFITKE